MHADDLRKRTAHDQRLEDRKDSELAAARHAFAPGAQNSFDNLVRDLETTVQQKGSKELILESAIREFDKMNITEASINDLKTKLEPYAQTVQPTLNAYRTAFNNYRLDVEGMIPAEDSSADDDRREIAGLFKKVDPKITMDSVLTKLESWFDDSKIKPLGPLPSVDPKYNRRNCAKTAFDKFKSSLSQQSLEVVGTETELFKKLGDRFLAELDEDKLYLKTKQKEITDKRQAFEKNEANKEEKAAVAGVKDQLEKTLTTVKSIKQAVLQQAEIAKVVDLSGLRHLLLLEIENQSKSATDPKKGEFQTAHDMLAAMSIPKSLQFVGGSHVKTQRDVLDDVIAQLQQQRLEAASRGGDLTALNKALELAYEQRGGLAYLRPASAYLRNAFSNTSVQDGNGGTNCSNLLLPFNCNSVTRTVRDTKREIDKQFWQTINTVRVRGGGTTDFAIVKDDVGNWYVKGLSSDPESIIKSAQSLALFNMGSKVNLDLLGQVETRRKLANLDISDSNRKTLKDELKEQQSGSGANTAGLKKVLDKYHKEYVSSTTTDVDDLIGKLDQLTNDITAAWQDINFGETKDTNLTKLKTLLANPTELITAKSTLDSAKSDLAKAAEPAVQASNTTLVPTQKITATDPAKDVVPASNTAKINIETAKANASNAIVKSLIEVRNMRSRLVKAIIQDDSFIATQRQTYDDAKITIDAEIVTVDQKKKEWEGADAKVTKAQALLDVLNAAVDKQKIELGKAKQDLITAQEELSKVRSAQETKVNNQRTILDNAVTRKNKAQAAVTAAGANATTAETLELTTATNELNTETKKLAEMQITSADVNARINARETAQTIQAAQQKILDDLTASPDIKSASDNLATAKDELTIAKKSWDEANDNLVKSRTAAKKAEDAYTLAKSNRLAAARKVTLSANSLIETTTANRLEAVKAYEVAIGFVGQTAGGQ